MLERPYSFGVWASIGFAEGCFVGDARRYEGPPHGGERKTTSIIRSR